MAKGQKTGGRKKGTPNKLSIGVAEKLEALGCDPIEGMAKIAMNTRNPAELRARMYRELAQYVAPKRKAIEFKLSEQQGLQRMIEQLQRGRDRVANRPKDKDDAD